LTQGIESGRVSVSEVEGGVVGRLGVRNQDDRFVFGMCGEMVVGGRQDRVLNTSVLIAPGAEVTIPVSCVEQRRWETVGRQSEFRGAKMAVSPTVRSAVHNSVLCNVIRTGRHRSDQVAVWNKVNDTLINTGANRFVPTGTLAGGMRRDIKRLDAYVEALAPGEGQNGMALFVPEMAFNQAKLDRVGPNVREVHPYVKAGFSGLDVFFDDSLMQFYAAGLLRGAAMEVAGESQRVRIESSEALTQKILDTLSTEIPHVRRMAAGGVERACELHYQTDEFAASALCLEDQVVHLTVTPIRKGEGPGWGNPTGSDIGPDVEDPGFDADASSCGDGKQESRKTRSGFRRTWETVIPACGRSQAARKSKKTRVQRTDGAKGNTGKNGSGAHLEIRIGRGHKRTAFFEIGQYTIGRSGQADIRVGDERVSRLHTRLGVCAVGGRVQIEVVDLDSQNGTYVNGRRVDRAILHKEDKLRLGEGVQLVFVDWH
jgi:hypothetical protein